jgi:hypothetical protein
MVEPAGGSGALDDAMEKLDLRKRHKRLYAPPAGRFEIVDVPPFDYLMIDGAGDPNSATEYQQAVEAFCTAAYTLQFRSKAELAATISFRCSRGCGGATTWTTSSPAGRTSGSGRC